MLGFLCLKIAMRMWVFDEAFYPAPEIEALTPDTEVLLAGASHLRFGVNPHRITRRAMNIGVNGNDYLVLERQVDGLVGELPGLKFAVIELDVVLMARTINNYRGDLRRFWSMGLVPSMLDIRNPVDRWAAQIIWALGPDLIFGRLTPRSIHKELNRLRAHRASALPVGVHFVPWIHGPASNGEVRVAAHLRQHRTSNNDPDANINALIRLVANLRARGVRVALVGWPHHATYWAHWPPEFDRILNRANQKIQVRFARDSEVVNWNFSKDPQFDDSHFADGNHLNMKGGDLMADLLDERIEIFLAKGDLH